MYMCAQAGMWVVCLFGEVARMYVSVHGFFFSPNMACEEGQLYVGEIEPVDMNMYGAV
jgi:hypothetical protein